MERVLKRHKLLSLHCLSCLHQQDCKPNVTQCTNVTPKLRPRYTPLAAHLVQAEVLEVVAHLLAHHERLERLCCRGNKQLVKRWHTLPQCDCQQAVACVHCQDAGSSTDMKAKHSCRMVGPFPRKRPPLTARLRRPTSCSVPAASIVSSSST